MATLTLTQIVSELQWREDSERRNAKDLRGQGLELSAVGCDGYANGYQFAGQRLRDYLDQGGPENG